MAFAHNTVLEILKRNWFQEVSAEQPRQWTFEEDLRNGGAEVVHATLELYGAFLGEKEPQFGPNTAVDLLAGKDTLIGHHVVHWIDLVRFLQALTLAEYRLDSLTWGNSGSEFSTYASQIGWPTDRLHDLHVWWHSLKATH